MNINEMKEKAKLTSALLRSINTEQRLLVICYLTSGSKTVNDIMELLQISQPATSQLLIRMKKEGCLKSIKKSQTIYYSISNQKIVKLFQTICNLY